MHCDVTGFPCCCALPMSLAIRVVARRGSRNVPSPHSGTAGRGAGLILSEGPAGEPTPLTQPPVYARLRCRWRVGKQGLAATGRDKAQGGTGRDAPSASEVKVNNQVSQVTQDEPHRGTLCCWGTVQTRLTARSSVLTSRSSVTGTFCCRKVCFSPLLLRRNRCERHWFLVS